MDRKDREGLSTGKVRSESRVKTEAALMVAIKAWMALLLFGALGFLVGYFAFPMLPLGEFTLSPTQGGIWGLVLGEIVLLSSIIR